MGDGSLVLASGRPVPADATPCRWREGVALVLDKFCQKAWRARGSQWKSFSSRLMSVRLKFSDRERFRVFSCYAPTFSSPRAAKDEFYRCLQAALAEVEDGEK